MNIGEAEKKTQKRVVDFFKDREILDYTYLGDLREEENKNIKEDRLKAYLKRAGYSDT